MQLRTYLELSNLSLSAMMAKLVEVAAPGELPERLTVSAISRHKHGINFPQPIMQELYSRATDRAVQPQDWVDLHMERRALPASEEEMVDA